MFTMKYREEHQRSQITRCEEWLRFDGNQISLGVLSLWSFRQKRAKHVPHPFHDSLLNRMSDGLIEAKRVYVALLNVCIA